MAVILTSPVEGKQPGETYEGPNEAFHIQNGYARPANKSSRPQNSRTTADYKHEGDDNPLNGDPIPTADATLPAPAPETFPGRKTPPKPVIVPTNLSLNTTPDADLPPVAPETLLGQEGREAHLADINAYERPEGDDDEVEPTAEELAAIEAGAKNSDEE